MDITQRIGCLLLLAAAVSAIGLAYYTIKSQRDAINELRRQVAKLSAIVTRPEDAISELRELFRRDDTYGD